MMMACHILVLVFVHFAGLDFFQLALLPRVLHVVRCDVSEESV
jgi:hypothetical protein